MASPRIAVVGDANKSESPELAKKAAEDLGKELARRKCRILVFTSDPAMIESDVVRGYLASKTKKEPGAIEVCYPRQFEGLFPGEKPGDKLFDRQPMPGDWEDQFYPYLANVDGLILIGGGKTTKIAGLFAIGARTPLLTLAGFGGTAAQILDNLRNARFRTAAEDELKLMAQPTWTDNSARRCVDALLMQVDRGREREKQAELLESEWSVHGGLDEPSRDGLGPLRRRPVHIRRGLALGSASAIVPLDAVRWPPGLAGASGAAIRVVWDHWRQDAIPLALRPIGMTVALGFCVSAIVGDLYVLPQYSWLSVHCRWLRPRVFSLSVAPVGLFTGLTLEKVFPKLITVEVPVDTKFPARHAFRGGLR